MNMSVRDNKMAVLRQLGLESEPISLPDLLPKLESAFKQQCTKLKYRLSLRVFQICNSRYRVQGDYHEVYFCETQKMSGVRVQHFPNIGELSKEDAYKALRDPALAAGVDFEEKALEKIYEMTHGYPYFLQEWGYKTWNKAQSNPIICLTVNLATQEVIEQLDNNFFRVRFDRLTPAERVFLRTMAELGEGPYKAGDIADKSAVKVSALSSTRANLMKKGMIYSPSYGYIAFTVPLFDQFMRRVMPSFSAGA